MVRLAVCLLLSLLLIPRPAASQLCWSFDAFLVGSNGVPPVETPGVVNFSASFESCWDCANWEGDRFMIRARARIPLEGEPVAVRICAAAAGVNGPILYEVPFDSWPLEVGIELDPVHCADLADTALCVVVTTSTHPDGEVRGQIVLRPPTPVLDTTWGRIRTIFR